MGARGTPGDYTCLAARTLTLRCGGYGGGGPTGSAVCRRSSSLIPRWSLLMVPAFVVVFVVASSIEAAVARGLGLNEGDLLLMAHTALAWVVFLLLVAALAAPLVLELWFAWRAVRGGGLGRLCGAGAERRPALRGAVRRLRPGADDVLAAVVTADSRGRTGRGRPGRRLAMPVNPGPTSACRRRSLCARPCRARRPSASRRRRPALSPRYRDDPMRHVSSSSSSPALRLVTALLARPRLTHQPHPRGLPLQPRPILPHQVQSHVLVHLTHPFPLLAGMGRARQYVTTETRIPVTHH